MSEENRIFTCRWSDENDDVIKFRFVKGEIVILQWANIENFPNKLAAQSVRTVLLRRCAKQREEQLYFPKNLITPMLTKEEKEQAKTILLGIEL